MWTHGFENAKRVQTSLLCGNTAWLWMVNGMILFNRAGDRLDGTLARVRNRQRPRYGFYVDHLIDAVSAVFLLGGLATLGTFRLSHGRFSPTEPRRLPTIGNVALYCRERLP